jgi:hypothetical protein
MDNPDDRTSSTRSSSSTASTAAATSASASGSSPTRRSRRSMPRNYAAAFAALEGMKGDYGRPLGIKPTHLIVPPSLREAAQRLINNAFDAAGASNPWVGTVKLEVVHGSRSRHRRAARQRCLPRSARGAARSAARAGPSVPSTRSSRPMTSPRSGPGAHQRARARGRRVRRRRGVFPRRADRPSGASHSGAGSDARARPGRGAERHDRSSSSRS